MARAVGFYQRSIDCLALSASLPRQLVLKEFACLLTELAPGAEQQNPLNSRGACLLKLLAGTMDRAGTTSVAPLRICRRIPAPVWVCPSPRFGTCFLARVHSELCQHELTPTTGKERFRSVCVCAAFSGEWMTHNAHELVMGVSAGKNGVYVSIAMTARCKRSSLFKSSSRASYTRVSGRHLLSRWCSLGQQV